MYNSCWVYGISIKQKLSSYYQTSKSDQYLITCKDVFQCSSTSSHCCFFLPGSCLSEEKQDVVSTWVNAAVLLPAPGSLTKTFPKCKCLSPTPDIQIHRLAGESNTVVWALKKTQNELPRTTRFLSTTECMCIWFLKGIA